MAIFGWMLLVPFVATAGDFTLEGDFVQGGMVVGRTEPGARVKLDGDDVMVSPDGVFVIGFGRDAASETTLEVIFINESVKQKVLAVGQRTYDIQRIDGLPARKVTPKPEDIARIKDDNRQIGEVRSDATPDALFVSGFGWPVSGTVSGVYGSQRILNGTPRNPHNGVDVAAPKGTPIVSPADGRVALVHNDMFYTGNTMMIDHGLGLTSVYAHMDSVSVKTGDRIKKGDAIGTVGMTGRATGPHLHWGLSWGFVHIDPALAAGPMPVPAKTTKP